MTVFPFQKYDRCLNQALYFKRYIFLLEIAWYFTQFPLNVDFRDNLYNKQAS